MLSFARRTAFASLATMSSLRPFTAHDFEGRIARAAAQAADAGLTGLLVTPGPDLTYFTGYPPTSISERITMLVIAAGQRPVDARPDLRAP